MGEGQLLPLCWAQCSLAFTSPLPPCPDAAPAIQVMDNVRAYKQFVTVGSYMLVQDTKLTR